MLETPHHRLELGRDVHSSIIWTAISRITVYIPYRNRIENCHPTRNPPCHTTYHFLLPAASSRGPIHPKTAHTTFKTPTCTHMVALLKFEELPGSSTTSSASCHCLHPRPLLLLCPLQCQLHGNVFILSLPWPS